MGSPGSPGEPLRSHFGSSLPEPFWLKSAWGGFPLGGFGRISWLLARAFQPGGLCRNWVSTRFLCHVACCGTPELVISSDLLFPAGFRWHQLRLRGRGSRWAANFGACGSWAPPPERLAASLRVCRAAAATAKSTTRQSVSLSHTCRQRSCFRHRHSAASGTFCGGQFGA